MVEKKKKPTPWWKVFKTLNDKKLEDLHPGEKEEKPRIVK